MTKPTIVTRAGKGSALSWTEGDANITNLRDATLIYAGQWDYNADFAPGSIVRDDSNDLYISLQAVPQTTVALDNTSYWQLFYNWNNGVTTDSLTQGSTNKYFTDSLARGAFSAGTGITITDGVIATTVTQYNDAAARAAISAGTGISYNSSTGVITNSQTAFDPSSPGTIGNSTAAAGTFTTLTANTSASLKGITEGALYDLGTTGGTIAPNALNGNVQKITLNSALTLNAFTSPVAGQSVTLIIYGGTAYTAITSTMKFAGGIKTLTATAGCIDIVSIYYDGTNYFASLGKGFA